MPRFVAFLRGVSPMNAKMPDLRRSYEAAGFGAVRTLLSSGNVVFDARATSTPALERRAERAVLDGLGRHFDTLVRPARHLQELLAADPFAAFELPPGAKPIVTFLRRPPEVAPALPIERDGACILATTGTELLSYYVPGDAGPAFMTLLERSFGKQITTRTLETVRKCAHA